MTESAFICGLEGPALTEAERGFLKEADPFGLILFARNVQTPAQVAALVAEARNVLGRHAPVLIDQEGGRVQRLRPPYWRDYPPGAAYGALYREEPGLGLRAAFLGARLIAADLHALGIDVDCLPIVDVPVNGADPIIGTRAYGTTPGQVAAIGRAVAEGLHAGGVLSVLKHIPGHGRATVDSHLALPVVDTPYDELTRTDFPPFRALADLPFAMTAHVVYTGIDPDQPATTSKLAIDQVIRGQLAFGGALMSDDLSMQALSGTVGARAKAALAAGCDLALHCNGKMDEMLEVAANTPRLAGTALTRTTRALAARRQPEPFDRPSSEAEFAALLARLGGGLAA